MSKFNCIESVVRGGKSVINLFGPINEKSATQFVEEFHYLESHSDEIEIRINSEGGSVLRGWSIVSTILSSKRPTTAVVVGVAASMASVVASTATVLKMYDYSTIMLHNPLYSAEPGREDAQLKAYRNSLIEVYMSRWGMSRKKVEEIMDGEPGEDGTWLNPDAAVKLGILLPKNIIKTTSQDRGFTSIAAAMDEIESKNDPLYSIRNLKSMQDVMDGIAELTR